MAFKSNEVRGEVFESLGDKLRNLRENKGLTLYKLSSELGISKTSLANYESGTRKVPLDILVKFSKYYSVSVDNLLDIPFGRKELKDYSIEYDFSHKIKSLRENNHLTKEELSNELDISIDELFKYENGTKEIPLSILIKFAKYFNVSIDELIGIEVKHEKTAFITRNKTLSTKYEKWLKKFGYDFEFTDEEINQLIDYAKYLISKREK